MWHYWSPALPGYELAAHSDDLVGTHSTGDALMGTRSRKMAGYSHRCGTVVWSYPEIPGPRPPTVRSPLGPEVDGEAGLTTTACWRMLEERVGIPIA